MELPIILDLRAWVGGGVDECPTFAIARDGEAGQCARTHTLLAGPGDPAHITIAVSAERRQPPAHQSRMPVKPIEFET